MTEIDTWVGDEVLCRARLTEYEPEEPPYMRGHPDNWEPGQPALIAWDLYDTEGKFDPEQLLDMASEEDQIRINDEMLAEIEAEREREMQP